MTIYMVMITSWNGECDVTTVAGAFKSEQKAKDFCVEEKKKYGSGPYSSTFEVEEQFVNMED